MVFHTQIISVLQCHTLLPLHHLMQLICQLVSFLSLKLTFHRNILQMKFGLSLKFTIVKTELFHEMWFLSQ